MKPEIKLLRDKLKGMGLNAMIVSNPISIKYLTGLDAEGMLLIDPKENLFITDSRYIESVNNSLTIDNEIVACDQKELTKYDYEIIFEDCVDVGFEERYVTYEKYKKYLELFHANLVETEGIIEKQRIVKEDYEIEKIKKACEITDKAFEYIIENIKKGMTEKQIAFELERAMILNGADGIAFETIVASGPNSSMPHAVPTDRVIQGNDIILFDFGAKYQGYCSDCSRTIFVGEPTEEQIKVYNFVLEEQKKIIANFKEGNNIKTVIRNRENDYSLEKCEVMHAFGHGVGLEIHELPFLNSKKDCMLKKNSIIAIEPGVYFPEKFGIRIEDTCIITKEECINLTKTAKTITTIKLA
jgi:Xaa-Pro aminopeptidase